MAKHFSMLPDDVAGRDDLGLPAKLLYALLLGRQNRGDPGDPGVRSLSRSLHLDPKTVRRARDRLVRLDLIVVSARGSGRSAVYQVIGPLGSTGPSGGPATGPSLGPVPALLWDPLLVPPADRHRSPDGTPLTLRSEDQDSEGESGALHPQTEQFRAAFRERTGHHVSVKVARFYDPCAVVGAPLALVFRMARERWALDRPWDLARKIVERWQRIRRTADLCHRFHLHGMGERPDQADRVELAQWAPELVDYAKGGPPAPVARDGAGDDGQGDGEGGAL